MIKNVIVIDDEETTVSLAKNRLERLGYQVSVAYDGQQALDLIEQKDFDLIISDVEMPVMDGVDLYKELKKKERTASVPIIIITSDKIFRDSFSISSI